MKQQHKIIRRLGALLAAGMLAQPITDEEVIEITSRRAGVFQKLLSAILEKL